MARSIKWGGATSKSTATTITSDPFVVRPGTVQLSIQWVWTGDTTGVITTEVSNDGSAWTNLDTVTTGLGKAAPAGTPANDADVIPASFVFVRNVYTRTSGTGLLTATVNEVVT